MMRSCGMAGSALLTLALAFGSPPAAAEPRATVGGDPNPARAAAVAPIRLDDDRLDRITAGHDWFMYVDLTQTPPTVAKVKVIHGSSVGNGPHNSWLVIITPLGVPVPINTSGLTDPLHWIDP